MDMIDRIKQLMEAQHMTQQTFSDFIGISSASLSSIFNGRTKPTLNTVEAIRSKFTKINIEWLITGNGPMFKDSASDDQSSSISNIKATEGMIDFDGASHVAVPSSSAPTPTTLSGSPRNYGSSSSVGADGMMHTSSVSGRTAGQFEMKMPEKPQRQITEIRIFFDDQTWQAFTPKK